MCEECEDGIHGYAEITPNGRVICACCRTILSVGIISDKRAK